MRLLYRGGLRYAVIAVLALFLVAGCAPAQPAGDVEAENGPAGVEEDVSGFAPAHGEELSSLAEVVAKVKPSVVAINTERTTYDVFNRPSTQGGAGSGWVIREDGYIVTNNHVVEGAKTVMVTLDDGRNIEADAVYTDPLTDLAVVKIEEYGLPAAAIGDSSTLQIGDALVAIGNSLGMGISATSGIASAVGVSLDSSPGQTLLDLVQTDAAINPGNSGGPLVDSAGEVIGINSIKIATVGVEGMGYAISINQALPIIADLIERGRVVRPWLGIGLYTMNAYVAEQYELAVDWGVLVTAVVADSPAHEAGLEPGDIIIKFAGEEVVDSQALARAIGASQVGDEVEIIYWREETKKLTYATLVASPPLP